jgi:hypothetical protein
MKQITLLSVMIIFLFGCSSRPSDSQIEKLMFGDNNDQIFRIDKFAKTDGFQKDDKSYTVDVQYNVVFKMGRKEIESAIGRDSNLIGSLVANLALYLQFGDFDKGATYLVNKKVSLIKKESGWAIEKIDDVGIQRIASKEEEEAKAARAKEEATLRKKQVEQEEAKRKAQAEARSRDENEWAKAQKVGTDEGYQAYLNQPDHDLHGDDAKNILATSAFERAQQVGTAEAYKKFLVEFPSSKPALSAKDNLEQILWIDANVGKTAASYREFLSLFPKGKFSEQAKMQIDELTWRETKEAGGEEDFQKYIYAFPSGRHTNEAKNLLDEISWNKALKENSTSSYLLYAKHYPRGKYIEICRQSAILATMKSHSQAMDTVDIVGPTPWTGLRVANISPEIISTLVQLGFKEAIGGGVAIVDVIPGQKRLFENVVPGDIILESNHTPINDVEQLVNVDKSRGLTWKRSDSWHVKYIRVARLESQATSIYAPSSFDQQYSSTSSKSPNVPLPTQSSDSPSPSTQSASSGGIGTAAQVGTFDQSILNSIKSAVGSYLGFIQDKQVDKAILAYSASKRQNVKRNILEAVARETEYYKVERIEPQNIEPLHSKVLVYLRHKKIKSPEEYWEITMEFANEQGEWKLLSTPGKRLR